MSDNEALIKIIADATGVKPGADSAASAIGELANKISEHAEGLKKAFEGILAAFAVEKIFDKVKELEEEFGKLGEQINRTAQMTGLSTDEVQKFNFAVELTGGNADGAAMALLRFEKNIGEASTGTGKAAEAFKALGINVNDSQGKIRPLNDLLGDVADKFKETNDGISKVTYANDLGGRSFSQLIPLLDQGREGLAALNAEMEKSGSKLTPQQTEEFEKLHQKTELLNKSWEGFKLAIADFFEPAAKKVVEWLTAITQAATQVVQWIDRVASSLSSTVFQKQTLYDIAHAAGLKPSSPDPGRATKANEPEEPHQKKKDLPPPPASSNLAAASAEDDTSEEDKIAQLAIDRNKMVAEQAIKVEQQKNQELLDDEKITNAQFLAKKLELQQQLDAIDLKAAQEKRDSYDQDTADYEKASNDMLAIAQKNALKEEQIRHEISLQKQVDLKEENKQQTQLATEINKSFTDSVTGVLNGTKTMKDAFHSFSASVIKDIQDMATKNLVNALFSGSSEGGAGGIGGMLAGLVGGSSGGSMSGGFGSGFSSLISGFRAGGGGVDSGKGYIVGENGPEYFSPGSNGAIFNQSQMSRATGNATIHMNINTPDANSFRQNAGQMMADMQTALRRSTRNA